MRLHRMITAGLCLSFATTSAFGQWKQFGGAKQDFKVKSKALAEAWPAEGPPKIWSRDIGEGYSGILVDKGKLYTMSREGAEEVVVAMKAKTGETVWEHRYDSPVHKKHIKEFNSGPRGAPLLSGKHLYTIGCSGKMHCLNAKNGKVQWSKDLWEEFDATFLRHGYSSSPFVYKKNVIAMVGGEGHALVAFNKRTGKVAWKKHDFDNSYSSPKLINVDGQDQLLCFMATEIAAINPGNGKLLWTYPHENQYRQNISLPVWSKKYDTLFITASGAGSVGLKLTQKDGSTKVEEVWKNNKVKIHHTNALRIGKHVYTSTGGRGPGLFFAVDIKTGEIAWKQRGFAKANCIHADGRLIILDEEGNLGLATATPDFFQIHAKVPVLGDRAWTVPTLANGTLYLRDSSKIVALDLKPQDEKKS